MIAKRHVRRWSVTVLAPLLVVVACSSGGEQVSVAATSPKDGVVVLDTGPMSDVGASNDFFVAFDRPALERDIEGTIFDAAGVRVGDVSGSPFQAPLLVRTVQDDGNNTVQVTGLECYDASMPGGDWACGRLRAAVARLDLTTNRWSDYSILDSPLVDLGKDAFARVEPLGFSGLIRVTGADTEGVWQRDPADSTKWNLLATDPRVPRSQSCVTNGRIYRGPALALRVGDSYGRIESAAIPVPSDTPPQLVWESDGPISNLPADNPNGNGINATQTFYLGCRDNGAFGFATGVDQANPSAVGVETAGTNTSSNRWTKLTYSDAPTGNASMIIDMRQGDGTIALLIMSWSAPAGEGTNSTVYRIDPRGFATQLGPHISPGVRDSGGRDIVIAARAGGEFVLVERRVR